MTVTVTPWMETAADAEDDWTKQAACAEDDVNQELFHGTTAAEMKAAKRICQGCPVRLACLRYALVLQDAWGVWGGLSERERRRLMRPAA